MKIYAKLIASALLGMVLAVSAMAQAESPEGPILFTNVNVFDGVSDKLITNANVVVTGNKITAVSTEDVAVAGGRVIDGGDRTLMPGLIEAHGHLAIVTNPAEIAHNRTFDYIGALMGVEAERYLMIERVLSSPRKSLYKAAMAKAG